MRIRSFLLITIAGLSMALGVRAQGVVGLNPTPLGVWQWNATSTQFQAVTNSYGLFPLQSAPQPVAFYGWNAALGQWVPCTTAASCALGSTLTLTTTGTTGAATYSGGILNIPVYQGQLTLTTTGSSGAATLTGDTLNIPNYNTTGGVTSLNALTGPVSLTSLNNSVAINPSGSTIDLSAAMIAAPLVHLNALVGAFTDGSGNIVEPIFIGNGPVSFAVPSGATQLQLGVNDDDFGDNGGSWTIAVNGTNYTVLGTTAPWLNTGTNATKYPTGPSANTSPIVISMASVGTATIQYISGLVTDVYYPGGVDADGDPGKLGTGTGASGHFFPGHYVLAQWPGSGGSTGTVTFVGMTVPSWLAVSGTPVTSTGTLAVTAASGQTQNEVLATPNGSSGAVSLRALVNGDLPSSGVTAGSYTNPTLTVNAQGVVTAASNGSGGGTTTNALTMNDSGAGAASGSSFNGSSAQTISYNTIGAAPAVGNATVITADPAPAACPGNYVANGSSGFNITLPSVSTGCIISTLNKGTAAATYTFGSSFYCTSSGSTTSGTTCAVPAGDTGTAREDGTNWYVFVAPSSTGAGGTPAGSSGNPQINASGSFGAQANVFDAQSGDTITIINSLCSTGATYDVSIVLSLTLTANTTLNCNVKFEQDGEFSLTGAYTLTMAGAVSGPPTQHFAGASTVILGPNTPVDYTEWFGAAGDGSTDDSNAIQAAINAVSAGGAAGTSVGTGNVQLLGKVYLANTGLTITVGGVGIIGTRQGAEGGAYGTVLKTTSASITQLSVAGTSGASISPNYVKHLTLYRSVQPTGTATGISVTYSYKLQTDDLSIMNDIRGIYIANAAAGGTGMIENTNVKWLSATVNCASGPYYGFYIDESGTNTTPSLRIRNDQAYSDASCANMTGLYAVGTTIEDIHVRHLETGRLGYGIYLNETGTPGSYNNEDNQFQDNILDQCAVTCYYISGMTTTGSSSVMINGGHVSAILGTGSAIYILNSNGVVVSGVEALSSVSHKVLNITGGGQNSFVGNTIPGAPNSLTMIGLINTSDNVVADNTLRSSSGSTGVIGINLINSSRNVISGNSMVGPMQIGIWLQGANYNDIRNVNEIDPSSVTKQISIGGVGNWIDGLQNSSYCDVNATASGTWTCYHGMANYPSVSCASISSGGCGSATITYPDNNDVQVALSAPAHIRLTFVAASVNTPASATSPTAPTFDTGCSSATQSCTATVTANDLAVVWCSYGVSSSSIGTMGLSSSPSATWTPNPGGYVYVNGAQSEAFYALGLASGSTTFTCSNSLGSTYPNILVLLYNPGTVVSLDTANMTNATASSTTFTSNTFSTYSHDLVVACMYATSFASITHGNIGGTAATIRESVAGQACEDAQFTTGQSNITATASSGSSVSWNGGTLAFSF